ncbi:MAG: hypothetical protein L6282_15990 [Candidatus Methanoperedenaceae archaeon]|nr:hypothetical protein [Candidatus Methanoperedenaceae archaeon]
MDLYDNLQPDYDIHAFAIDGRHMGRNYTTDIYEYQIAGATASGDMIWGVEWIFVPDYEKVVFRVSDHDIREYLKRHPEEYDEVAGIKTSIIMILEDNNSNRTYVNVTGEQFQPYEDDFYFFDVIEKPDGTFELIVENKRPVIQLYPVNGTEFYWGQYLKIDYNVSYPRSFEGKTSVTLDGIPAAKGDIIDTKFMFQGRHEIRVAVEDSSGNITEASTTISIKPFSAIIKIFLSDNRSKVPEISHYLCDLNRPVQMIEQLKNGILQRREIISNPRNNSFIEGGWIGGTMSTRLG